MEGCRKDACIEGTRHADINDTNGNSTARLPKSKECVHVSVYLISLISSESLPSDSALTALYYSRP